VKGDGDGWTTCAQGHRHWGRYGAAGLLLTDGRHVLVQQRASWVQHGGTWGIPGGARDSHEDALTAAVREASEEGVNVAGVEPVSVLVDDHGGWSYTTVITRVPGAPRIVPSVEVDRSRWVALDEVAALPLHSGFADSWSALRRDLAFMRESA